MPGNIFDEPDSAADLAIVGLGPGGLAAALQAAKNGKAVLAFTDRDNYIRGQRLILSQDTVTFLKKHTDNSMEDKIFWTKYENEHTIQTKDIERFLYRKLIQQPNVQIVQLSKQTTKNISSVNKDENANIIKLEDGTQYYCKNILAADGARHGFADMVNKNLGSDIDYEVSPLQERHRYHAVVQLQLKKEEKPGPVKKESIVDKMLSFARQGWTETYLPKNYTFPNAAQTKFYFAGGNT